MTIEIKERFQVGAPVEEVWRFVMDPHRVAACMPGATLDELVDEKTFLGAIKVKVGAITTTYKGRVQLSRVDEQGREVQMSAQGRETGGGTASATMSSRLRALPDGSTEVSAEASLDLTGRVMQVGRGMIQGISHELFQQFVACAKAQLEGDEGSAASAAAQQPVRIVPIVLRVLWASFVRFVRRLFRRSTT